MGIFSFILENVGEFALGRILDRIFDDKAKNMEDAFDEAYNTWYVSHNNSVIQRKDYDRLKQRFIDYLCNKEGYKEDEDEISLYKEWLKVIERGINAHDKLQSNIIQKIINKLGQFKAYQVQINEEMLIKLTGLVESAISIEDISKKQASLEKEIGEIKSLIANKGLDSALQPQQFPKVEGYIEHYVISEKDKNNFVRYILKQKPQTLYEKVCAAKDGENKFLLVDKGQSGKTTELQELGYKLSQSNKYFPLLMKAYDKPNLSKDDLPVGDIYEGKNIVLLIDAADEFSQKERGCFFNFIKDYANEHLHTIIVVSCRNNYEETENLKCFQSLVFEDLSTDQWKNMIRVLAKDNADTLINLIIEKGLQEYMATPFEVSVITNHYLSEGDLLTTRAGIYRQFIYSKLEQDDKKLRTDGKQLKYDALPYLERIATVMQSYGNDFTLTYRELLNCVDNKENTLKLIQRSNLIIPIGQDKYKFSENAYREYLAAEYVSKQDFNSILSFIKYDSAGSIRQHWANVTIILLSILNNENVETFNQLLDWLIRYEPEFVLFMERNTVEKKTREAVFRNLLAHYRKQHRIIAPANHQTSKKIIEFAQSTETMEFLLTEVLKNKDTDDIYLENLYSFIEYADFTDLTLCGKQKLVDNFTNVVFHLISKHLEDNKEKTFTLYFPLNNPYYHEDDTYTKRLLDTVGESHNRYAVDAALTMICFTDSRDEYADYIINHEADIHDYQDERGITVSVLRFIVDKALEGVKEKDNIIKVLNHICKRDFLLRNSYRDDDTLNIVKNLLKNAKDSRFINDKEACQSLLEVYGNFMGSSVFNKQKDLNLTFEDFFKNCTFNDQFFIEAVDKFKQILENGNIDEYLKTISIIGLFLTKERYDSLIETLDPANNIDYEVAGRIYNLHDSNLDDYIGKKMDEKFGRHPVVVSWDSKKKESINQLLNYDKFRDVVIKTINKYPQKRKDLKRHSVIPDDNTDLYVSSFFYETSDEPFDLDKIKAAIDDKEYYYHFLLYIYHRDRGDKEFENSLNDSIRKEIVNAAEQEIILDAPTDASLYMFVNDKLGLHYEDVEKLLRLSNYTWGEKSLFNRIADIANKEGKQSNLLNYLCKHLREYKGNADLYATWACYIIRNDKKNFYPVIFDWMLNDEKQWRHIQIIEAYWSMNDGKKFIRYNFSRFSENDKVSLLHIIESSKDKEEADWISGQLTDYANYEDYNKKAVLQFLLYRGDLNVLRFVVDHFEPKYLESDYSYNYNQDAATDDILFLFHKIVEDGGKVVPNCYTSLKQSLINISQTNYNMRDVIIKDLQHIALQHHEWLYDEIERIQEELLNYDDENKSFEDVLNSVPLIKINVKRPKSINSEDYKTGNIVRLRDDKFVEIKEKFLFPQNLFYMKEIRDNKEVVLYGLRDVVDTKDILPVKIDGKQDRNIYYDFNLANDVNKGHKIDDIKVLPDSYYMDSLKNVGTSDGISWYDHIKQANISYVHQIQNDFQELALPLKIHYLPKNTISDRKSKVNILKDVCGVVTKSKYLNLIKKDPSLEKEEKIYITKEIDENNLVATKRHKDKFKYDYVLLFKDEFLSHIDFYSFYLNSILGRIALLGGKFTANLHGNTNIKNIKEVPVFFIDGYMSSCCVLQSILELLLTFLFKKDDLQKELQPLHDYLRRVGNAMVAEMAIPKYFDEFGIKILDSWTIEVKKIFTHINEITNDTTGFYLIQHLFVSLFSSDNELTKNMNKYRLYSTEFIELVAQKGLRQ